MKSNDFFLQGLAGLLSPLSYELKAWVLSVCVFTKQKLLTNDLDLPHSYPKQLLSGFLVPLSNFFPYSPTWRSQLVWKADALGCAC